VAVILATKTRQKSGFEVPSQPTNSFWDPISEKTHHKKKKNESRAGASGVAQGEGPRVQAPSFEKREKKTDHQIKILLKKVNVILYSIEKIILVTNQNKKHLVKHQQ
jgi:hypothetical protein